MAFSPQPRIKISHLFLGFSITITLLIIITCLFKAQGPDLEPEKSLNIKRSDFPKDFAFGVSTAALQIEGSANEGGRTPSIWDNYSQIPGKIIDGSNTSTGIDSYKRYKEDVKLLKDLGTDYYRFSISWTRILPQGSLGGGINQEGIDYYNDLIDELIKNGIKPFVTILHFDTPQALEDKYGSFLNRSIVNDFKDYCEILFRTYGDRVKNWITVNEPYVVALGYDIGYGPPGRCSLPPPIGPCAAGNSSTEPDIVAHNFILAHATAVNLYRDKFQAELGGQIGISLVAEYMEPYSDSPDDKAAAQRYLDFLIGWYVEPLVYGDYPKTMRDIVKERLPTFSGEEKMLIKGSFDFIAINYYTSRYASKADPVVPTHYLGDYLVNTTIKNRDGIPIGPKAEGNEYVYIYPQGLQKVLEFVKQKYQNPPIYITENGIPDKNIPELKLDEALNDSLRIKFILQHLYQANKALKKGANLKGYFYWSLFDDFEWIGGYAVRFGLYYVDYRDNYKRIPKHSAKWLSSFLKSDNSTTQLQQHKVHHKPTGYPTQQPTNNILTTIARLNAFF